jgi:cytochrome c5
MTENPLPPTQAKLTPLILIFGVVTIVATLAALAGIVTSIPDQKAMLTPVVVEGAPAFAAAVEAKVAAADPSKGEAVYTEYGCVACHSQEYGAGPSLVGIGARAATRRPNYSAAAYLYESIVNPNAYTVPDYAAGVMLQNFKDRIPEDRLYDLVAWLLTR